jgi:hypothetical protein
MGFRLADVFALRFLLGTVAALTLRSGHGLLLSAHGF